MSVKLLAFCLRSLYREYGVAFLLRVVLAHPLATARGLARYTRGESKETHSWRGGPGSLVGLAFCLKPPFPACPSGRANHDCMRLENGGRTQTAACQGCLIGSLGRQALAGGSAVYVMTSARDMLADVLLPALEKGRFQRAMLTMCRYSFEPIGLAAAICGIEARQLPFAHGDCRDYAMWRQADVGHKSEQTVLENAAYREMDEALSEAARGAACIRVRRNGNVYDSL